MFKDTSQNLYSNWFLGKDMLIEAGDRLLNSNTLKLFLFGLKLLIQTRLLFLFLMAPLLSILFYLLFVCRGRMLWGREIYVRWVENNASNNSLKNCRNFHDTSDIKYLFYTYRSLVLCLVSLCCWHCRSRELFITYAESLRKSVLL